MAQFPLVSRHGRGLAPASAVSQAEKGRCILSLIGAAFKGAIGGPEQVSAFVQDLSQNANREFSRIAGRGDQTNRPFDLRQIIRRQAEGREF